MPMTIPFLNFFKKVKDQAVAKAGQPGAVRKPAAPIEKPSSERFSKTVMPNATRSLQPQDPFEMAARSSVGGASAVAPAPSASRTIAFGATTSPARPSDLPPAVALALEPMVERAIALHLADIVGQIPADYIKPIESIDGTRRILVKASEVEKGMASKKPAVSLAAVYQQVPEIFLRSVAPSDQTEVKLPFTKVLEQFGSLQVRSDQERQQAVPQVETPFLKVTLEDNSRFGTPSQPIEPIETGEDLPPVRIQLATAEALAAAEPEIAGNGCGRHGSETSPAMPTRISLEISPNGTGGSAPESVPASSEPSVPTSFVSSPAPTRIPFKIPVPGAVPGDNFSSKHEPCSTAVVTPKGSEGGVKMTLPLKPILRGLPPSQLGGDAASVPADAQIELPFSVIEPQLVTGRITVSPAVFAAGLPAEYQRFFNAGEPGEVILPLQEVLKNIPASSLRMREDQVEQEAGLTIATPFSAKADEDAKRFNLAGTEAAEPTVAPLAAGEEVRAPSGVERAQAPATPPSEPFDLSAQNSLQIALETDEKLDDKGVVAHVNKLAGVKGCALIFGDGLSLAGSLPPEYETDGLCAMAPSLMQRVEKHMVETKLGALRGMTLTCAKGAITFFMHDNLCLAALHASGDLSSEVQEKLARVVHELSRKYSHPV